MSKKIEIFKDFLEKFETDEIRDYCRDMIELMPDYIFQIPSSTSLKYHNATQCHAGGQILHVLMCCEIINYVLGLEWVQTAEEYKFNIHQPKKRDCMRVAMCLHDALKCGNNGSSFTVHKHPLLASEWVRTTTPEHDIKQPLKDYIGRLIESHSGQWTTSNRDKTVLPSIENNEQFIIHLCDYLGSRSNLDMIYSDELMALVKSVAIPDPKDYFMPFGKYKNISFELVAATDKAYLVWLRDMSGIEVQEPLKTYLEQLGDEI